MGDINCTGYGGVHPRPGGSRCKNLRFGVQKEENIVHSGEESDSDSDLGATSSNSMVAWDAILSQEEISAMPERSEDSYLPFCEKIINDLQEKVTKMSEDKRVSDAEKKITGLMSQLNLGASKPRRKSCLPATGHQVPATGLTSPRYGLSGHSLHDISVSPGVSKTQLHSSHMGFPRAPVEPGDTKDYIGKLRPENHLVPLKTYDNMNYRELVLGMDGVHAHLIANNCCVSGYEAHAHFVKRKSVSFLYSNSASVLYDRYVTDRVISGEYLDYPSSCPDASLEYFCDSYRRENTQKNAGNGNYKSGTKPWSGYPFPFCYFHNEGQGCYKKQCNLRHECGYCQMGDHKSKDCSKSQWKVNLKSKMLKRLSRIFDITIIKVPILDTGMTRLLFLFLLITLMTTYPIS